MKRAGNDAVDPAQSGRAPPPASSPPAGGGQSDRRPFRFVLAKVLAVAGGVATLLALVTGGLTLVDRLRAAQTPTTTTAAVYRPFAVAGDNVTVKITQTTRAGSCFGQSDYVDRPDAWRCANDQGLLDPCFSSGNRVAPPRFVLCPLDGPQKPAVELPLAQPLTDSSADQRLDNQIIATSLPWYLLLSNGAQCRRVTPVQNASGLSQVRFFCSDGSDGVGDVVRTDKLWTILVAPKGGSTEKPMAIREAWF